MKQIFLRHKNGNGKIFGNDALVAPTTFLSRGSSVGDDAEVYGHTIIDSIITDKSIIAGAHIEDSLISEQSRIFGGQVLNSTISGQSHIWETPSIVNCDLKDVFVFGDADLEGFQLSAPVRIHSGRWRSAPRYQMLTGPELKVVISECTEDRAHLGCWCLPYDTWFRPGYRQRIGARSGWTPKMIEIAYQQFQTWRG